MSKVAVVTIAEDGESVDVRTVVDILVVNSTALNLVSAYVHKRMYDIVKTYRDRGIEGGKVKINQVDVERVSQSGDTTFIHFLVDISDDPQLESYSNEFEVSITMTDVIEL